MKKRLYHSLFRVFSYLSDKTNGAPFVVKYKLIFGTLLIGLIGTSVSCVKKNQPNCYEALPVDTTQIIYKETVAPDNTTDNQVGQIKKFNPPTITCYDTVIVNMEEKVQIKKFEPQDMSDSIVTVVTCYMPSVDALKRVDENIEKIKDSIH
ncbi:MAG: hypothetical protein ACK5M3_05965 [Dysgonomonas sp.]